jgi:hypothetical protein
MKEAKNANMQVESKSAQRKSYHSPKLSHFGTVTQLTHSAKAAGKTDGKKLDMAS